MAWSPNPKKRVVAENELIVGGLTNRQEAQVMWPMVFVVGAPKRKYFFPCCYWWTRSPFCIWSYLPPIRVQPVGWGTIPDGSPSKDWQSTVGWGDCRIQTQVCRFTVWCHDQWTTTNPKVRHGQVVSTGPQINSWTNNQSFHYLKGLSQQSIHAGT